MRHHFEVDTSEIPQADRLDTLKTVIRAVAAENFAIANIADFTGISARHVRYRLQAARVLRFIAVEEFGVTDRGSKLLESKDGSDEERKIFRKAIRESPVMKVIAPTLLSKNAVSVSQLADDIIRLTGLSEATANRRARGLASWAKQVNTSENNT